MVWVGGDSEPQRHEERDSLQRCLWFVQPLANVGGFSYFHSRFWSFTTPLTFHIWVSQKLIRPGDHEGICKAQGRPQWDENIHVPNSCPRQNGFSHLAQSGFWIFQPMIKLSQISWDHQWLSQSALVTPTLWISLAHLAMFHHRMVGAKMEPPATIQLHRSRQYLTLTLHKEAQLLYRPHGLSKQLLHQPIEMEKKKQNVVVGHCNPWSKVSNLTARSLPRHAQDDRNARQSRHNVCLQHRVLGKEDERLCTMLSNVFTAKRGLQPKQIKDD